MRRTQNSQVFISVLIVLTIVLVLGAGMLFYSRSFRDATKLQVDTDKAYALAKTGINLGESFVAKSPTSPMSPTIYNFADGTATVQIATIVYTVGQNSMVSGTITSTGKYKNSTRVLKKKFAKKIQISNTWVKAYGEFTWDYLRCLQQTSDGGYILGGHTASYGAGGYDFLLIKTDASGTVQWAKAYGGLNYEELTSLQQTSDGGYILGGFTYPNGQTSVREVLVIKVNSSGVVAWAKTYGDGIAGPSTETLFSLQQTLDGGYILGGTTNLTYGDFLVIKTDSEGRVGAGATGTTWSQSYGTTSYSEGLGSLQQTSDGGYLLGGYTTRPGNSDLLVIKINSSGDWLSRATYENSSLEDITTSLQLTSDGGYILGGNRGPSGYPTTRDFLMVKIDSANNVSWAKTYGGSGDDMLSCLRQTSDGGYILGGPAGSFSDFLAIKTDSTGAVGWAKTYGGSKNDALYSLQQTADGYILGGDAASFGPGIAAPNFLAIKTDSSGNLSSCTIQGDTNINPAPVTYTKGTITLKQAASHMPTAFSCTPTNVIPTTTPVCPSQ